jgi:membrane-bound acyltransferase YfiQ involved in biofilm formation
MNLVQQLLPSLVMAAAYHVLLERGVVTEERVTIMGAWPWTTICLCVVTVTCVLHSVKTAMMPLLTILAAVACFTLLLYSALLLGMFALADPDKRHDIVQMVLSLIAQTR